MVNKNEEYVVEILDNGIYGEGICKINDFTIFIPGAVKEDKLKILIVKVNSSFAFGKIVEILSPSKYRQDPICDSFKKCGGCMLQHMDYDYQLELKTSIVNNTLNKIGLEVKTEHCIGMGIPVYYRNKAQYPFGYDKENNKVMGFYKERSHEIVPLNNCYIESKVSTQIAKYILNLAKELNISLYNETDKKGILRHSIIKIGYHTSEIMVILVCTKNDFENLDKLVYSLTHKFDNIKTVILNINKDDTNVIQSNENQILFGDGTIHEHIGKYLFKISPNSFFQVNSKQVELLYHLVKDFADIDKKDIVFDLYCGAGTIGIFIAENANKVYGIELVKDAVKMAKENADINNVDNIEFICGDVEDKIDELINKNINPSIIILDPPRKGLSDKTVEKVLELLPKKIVYVSCNVSTLARDLNILKQYYLIDIVQPVDMFPQTYHVECVSLLSLIK